MDLENFAAAAGFALVATITPGPNNIMVMASGANFGFRRTMLHMLGITFGFSVMITSVGVGLVVLFDALPILHTVLKVVSAGYLLLLAWNIANAASPEAGASSSRPFTFLQAAAFQWVNPKSWTMGLAAITLYAPDQSPVSVMLVALAFSVVGFPAIALWAWMGTVLRSWLSNNIRLRTFNIGMSILLVASLYPMLIR